MLPVDPPNQQDQTAPPIRVLVVDDSAFMRYSLSLHLGQQPGLQVAGVARDGREALDMIPAIKPDVVTLDVEMPRLDGISTLREIMARFPLPVVMLSSLTREGTVETIQALTLGAVDFVAKPVNKVDIAQVMAETAAKIKRAAHARVQPGRIVSPPPPPPANRPETRPVLARLNSQPIVFIGTSTGGPRALNEVIPALPANLPAAVVVVQHMPAGFTRSLADRLNSVSQLRVKEAEPGDQLAVGQVLLAPGGFHMTLEDGDVFSLNQKPTVHGVRPAVDVTLISIAQKFGKRVVAAILTGMGSDGTHAASLVHSMGGYVIAEHESTAVVWGMPRSVVEAGAADSVVPLPEVASAIERAVYTVTKNTASPARSEGR